MKTLIASNAKPTAPPNIKLLGNTVVQKPRSEHRQYLPTAQNNNAASNEKRTVLATAAPAIPHLGISQRHFAT
jgi:hypothetical protein